MPGASGPQGPQGDPGATGPQGPQGPAGVVTANAPLSLTGTTLSIDLSAYAPLASPTFTGNPTAPTPTAGDNDTSIATTAFVNTKAGNYLPLAGGTLTGTLTISSAGALVVQSTAASTSPSTGALTVAGGLGVGGAINANSYLNGTVLRLNGSQVVTGGAGDYTQIYDGVGDAAFIAGVSADRTNYHRQATHQFASVGGAVQYGNWTATGLQIASTTPSTSPTTGALTVAGGIGVGGNIWSGGNLYGHNIVLSDAAPSLALNASGGNFLNLLAYNNGVNYFDTIGSLQVRTGPTALAYNVFSVDKNSGNVAFQATGDSSSPTTGALTVAGGIGVGGNIYVGGNGYKPAGGPWLDSSDARIKTVVSDYEHGLAEVLQLAPRRYRYKGNDTTDPTTATKLPYEDSPHYSVAIAGTEYIGLIAQEVETVMPEMVTLASGYIDGKNKVNDLRTLDTGALIYALVNSIKELHARVQALEGAVI
jgi:hypothetical protein